MDLIPYKDIKIAEIIEIQSLMKQSIKTAIPKMQAICERNGIAHDQWKKLCEIAVRLEM